MLGDFGDGSGGVREDARDELEGVRVPFFGHVGSFVLVVGRFVGESLCQVLLVDAYETPLVSQVPVREIAVIFTTVEGIVDFHAGREQGLRYVEDFAAISPVAVCGEMAVELRLEAHVVARGGVVGRCCEGPAHVSLAGDVVVADIVVEVVLGDLVELAADGVGDVFYDFGGGGGAGEVVAEEGLVEGEDAFDFDAEGELEGGVDHFRWWVFGDRRLRC